MQLAELRSEVAGLFTRGVRIADGVVPPLVFVIANQLWGLSAAAGFGVGSALAITGWRVLRGHSARFATAGLAGTATAAFLALRTGAPEDYFLPGILGGAATTLLIAFSNLARRPFVAWSSWVARGWPLDWYWHPRVRPAYARAGWMWAGFFASRTLLQWRLYVDENAAGLAAVRIVMGWPALLALLIVTYILGRRWLLALSGPSVEEFAASLPPPWKGQQAGF